MSAADAGGGKLSATLRTMFDAMLRPHVHTSARSRELPRLPRPPLPAAFRPERGCQPSSLPRAC